MKKPPTGRSKARSAGKTPSKQDERSATNPRTRKGGVAASLDIAAILRDRLNHELDLQKVPVLSRPAYLAMMTGRAAPSCRRWLDPQNPGMPDLQSFASLCLQFEADANYFLGFTSTRFSAAITRDALGLPAPSDADSEPSRWIETVGRALENAPSTCAIVIMKGDEMAPKINNGGIVFVDKQVTELQGNGTYYIEFQGRRLIRNVEDRLSDGLVLSCENPKYRETVVPTGTKSAMTVLGRVSHSVSVMKY